MKIWLSKDEYRLPLMVEAKILVGSVKAILDRSASKYGGFYGISLMYILNHNKMKIRILVSLLVLTLSYFLFSCKEGGGGRRSALPPVSGFYE